MAPRDPLDAGIGGHLADEVVRIKIDYAARLAATKWWMSSS
jgi:hypothetical protein